MKAWHFEIRLINRELSVLEYEDDEARALKENGEECWPLGDTPDFWSWLADKIRYDGEPVSFVLIADEPLIGPPPGRFRLVEGGNHCHQSVPEDCDVRAWPELAEPLEQEKPRARPEPPRPVQRRSLQGYFVRKTREYEAES